ncbi:hypothetical protein KGQ20_00275 [Catenulispora sp. NF23]|uniref:TIGR03067 domain-containing protein n=1 Tax=Catenulispora pinistramenti TaxID=2705254 RepID=A0ABS5KKU1_9ACTN|nr:hypothetical protein [Catenulispora pinistramenti]MBS2531200.1 hypothetical protein [Catenulispora pinistramenti]MBS2546657.1 hypothetical protein [Catenulispora pinistramenti]
MLTVLALPFGLLAMRDLGGARTVTPSFAGLVGTWRSKDGATLALSADGMFVATNMPAGSNQPDQAFPGTTDLLDLPRGSGTWSVRQEKENTAGGIDLWTAAGETVLETKGNPEHPTLFAFIGDPDDANEYVFVKQAASG